MALSRWSDNSDRNIEGIITYMMNYRDWHEADLDPIDNQPLAFIMKKFFPDNKTITLNGNSISFNYIEYEYEKIRPGVQSNELKPSRIQIVSGFVIVYSDGIKTQYITNRANQGSTKTILRKLNNYSGQKEITKNEFDIQEDLFTWLIYNLLYGNGGFIEPEAEIYINRIIGFKGSTNDTLATVTGTGDRIMNLLSTLAFLFENESLTYIKPIVNYNNDTVEFAIDLNGTIDVDLDTYNGDDLLLEEFELKSKVILKIALEILPKIISSFHSDLENDEWSRKIKEDFFKKIGEKIVKEIDHALK